MRYHDDTAATARLGVVRVWRIMCAADGARVTIQNVHWLCRLRRPGEVVLFLPLTSLFRLLQNVAREAPDGSECMVWVLRFDWRIEVVLRDFCKAILKLAAVNVHRM